MPKKRNISSYSHADKGRPNNPPVGLVTPSTDPTIDEKQTYRYDPHLDPQLQWAGKDEHTSFAVPIVSLHVHERIDPHTIIDAVRKNNSVIAPVETKDSSPTEQISLFEQEREVPLREAVEFYKHSHNWSNRLVAGDSLLVMNSLLQKENMAGKVQCIYMDPPYGIKYGSNFQPFVNKREVKDGKDEDLTAEPETIKAFRDTWELGIHSYLSYLRDRLLLARELLSESGSVFVQISDENVHHVREIMDEVFGVENFVSLISFTTTSGIPGLTLSRAGDYLIWYGKDKRNIKYKQLFEFKDDVGHYNLLQLPDGSIRSLTNDEQQDISLIPQGSELCASQSLTSQGATKSESTVTIGGKKFKPPTGQHWKTTLLGIKKLHESGRILSSGKSIRYLRKASDFPVKAINNIWFDTVIGSREKEYVVQTSRSTIEKCLLMTTDPGDLVLDPTCGSGTTAYVAEQWGRRWMTCDTSRVATALTRQRLMTAMFDYYKLAHPDEGVGSGFEYKKVPHVTLKSIANNEPAATETLYDQPIKDTRRARVTGPFTVEAVPSPTVQPIADVFHSSSGREKDVQDETFAHAGTRALHSPGEEEKESRIADASINRSGETLRQEEWRNELLKVGIRGKSGQRVSFSRVEPLPCHWLHADAETKTDDSGEGGVREAATAYHPPPPPVQ